MSVKKTIYVEPTELKRIQDILDRGPRLERSDDKELASYHAQFSNGFFATIKVYSGYHHPYVDAALFDANGNEVWVIQDDGSNFDGPYDFGPLDGVSYVVEIVSMDKTLNNFPRIIVDMDENHWSDNCEYQVAQLLIIKGGKKTFVNMTIESYDEDRIKMTRVSRSDESVRYMGLHFDMDVVSDERKALNTFKLKL